MRKPVLSTRLKNEGFTLKTSTDGEGYEIKVKNADGQVVGTAFVDKVYKNGKYSLQVGEITVQAPYRQKKIGTWMYEALQKLSCKEKLPLQSAELRSYYAERFWRKQTNKGRAICHSGKGDVFLEPTQNAEKAHRDACEARFPGKDEKSTDLYNKCVKKANDLMYSKLPSPDNAPVYGFMWPCRAYELKAENCGKTLEGLKSKNARRTRRARVR